MCAGSRNLLALGTSECHLLKTKNLKDFSFSLFFSPFFPPAVSVESVMGCCDNSRRLLGGLAAHRLSCCVCVRTCLGAIERGCGDKQ